MYAIVILAILHIYPSYTYLLCYYSTTQVIKIIGLKLTKLVRVNKILDCKGIS